MNVYIRTVISFDPVKEHNQIDFFKQRNPDWKIDEATTGTSFINEERYYYEPDDYSYGDEVKE